MVDLGKIRKEHDLTQAELAQKVGISQRAVAYYESGERGLPIRIAKLYGAVFEMPWTDFYQDEDEAAEEAAEE